ncbi:hypothetical protein ACMD2_20179 [Ananas comosus]|uniref:Uncharacterized protein n=1 Tax=Ananas comosus TaxID=4615 RepID=A0A199W8X8_ANACO|nr:hypothetical protein ACMD2_20179 [Ananas comosus]
MRRPFPVGRTPLPPTRVLSTHLRPAEDYLLPASLVRAFSAFLSMFRRSGDTPTPPKVTMVLLTVWVGARCENVVS